ncbi:MAG: VOC family protein, partial [Deltaproteobacteria bacterium]|nr:VOC family protein [Deltaproteobacteria bacterium]
EKLLENPDGKTLGYHHIGIEVDDIDAKYKELTEKGYTLSVPPKDIENMRIAFFDGPENVTFELLQLKT